MSRRPRRRPRASSSTSRACARSSARAGSSLARRATCCKVEPHELDAARFRRLVGEARNIEPERAARKLREALDLWRGRPLADLEYEPFAQPEIARLREARLAALEQRIDADLAAGRHAALVGELEALVSEHPLRERLWAQLMLALYRSSRQAEALEAYRAARRSLSEELGLEPGTELKQLEQAILTHDPELDLAQPSAAPRRTPAPAAPERSVLVVPDDLEDLPRLLRIAEPLAGASPPRELVIAAVVAGAELGPATAALADRRDELHGRGVPARAAAFTSPAPGDDIVRLAGQDGVDLLLMDAGAAPLEGTAREVLERAPCDVAMLVAAGGSLGDGPGHRPVRRGLARLGGARARGVGRARDRQAAAADRRSRRPPRGRP